jgi:hypothetical protein
MATESITIEMKHAKSTKRTEVYKAPDEGRAAVDTVYVQKVALPIMPPQRLTVTITFEK